MDAAIALFAGRGPASVSLRDVARHAGVNQGRIYRHLGSKRPLLSEVLYIGVSGLLPAAFAPGSSIWGAHLRPVLGLSQHDGLDAAVADAARWLVPVPHSDSFRAEARR